MARYCPNCGAPVGDGAKFCGSCGTQLTPAPRRHAARRSPAPDVPPRQSPARHAAPQQPAAPQQTIDQQPPSRPAAGRPQAASRAAVRQPANAGNGAVRTGIPAPGFSDRVDHPEIVAAVRRNRTAAGFLGLLVVPLPLVGFVMYSKVTGGMELGDALRNGAFVSAVFLAFALASMVRAAFARGYEATVIDKYTELAHRHSSSDDGDATYLEYITVARTASGRRKKIVEHEGSPVWAFSYLEVGDRFRYHAQFNFPYEKYDKATAPFLVCVSCGTRNPLEADRCSRCDLPLLK